MAKLWASAPERDRAAPSRTERESVGERPIGTPPSLDAEMQELVRRFEQGYAEPAPSAEEAQRKPGSGDELFPDFPDVFADPPPARRTVTESARVVPISRREDASPAPTPKPSWPHEPAAADNDVDLDEAMAILRESEQRTRPARPEAPDASAAPVFRALGASTREPAKTSSSPPPAEQPAPAMNWTARSHTTRTVAGFAAIVALTVGVAGGYLLARTPSSKSPSAHIESSLQGGTQLKLERTLRQQ